MDYQYINLIADAFEEYAINSGRNGILAHSNRALDGFDQILETSEFSLSSVKDTRERPPSGGGSAERITATVEGDGPEPPRIAIEGDLDLQEILQEVFGDNRGTTVAERYVRECLGCNLRIRFDWEFKPLDLIPNLRALFDKIKASLDLFRERLDPLRALSGLCNLLNAFRGVCIPDIIAFIMSLRMLLKKYLSNSLKIKFDWTSLLGPLIRALTGAVTSFLNNISAFAVAPLECLFAVLRTANSLEQEVRNVAALVDQLANSTIQTQNNSTVLNTAVSTENVYFRDGEELEVGSGFDVTKTETDPADRILRADTFQDPETGEVLGEDPGLITGFNIDLVQSLKEAMKDPKFINATFLEKALVPLKEVISYIQKLTSSINNLVRSLDSLVGGGLQINLENLGAVLFIIDMISLMTILGRILATNRSVNDWCRELEENPSLVENVLNDSIFRRRLGVTSSEDFTIQRGDQRLILNLGNEAVAHISTCATDRTDNNVLNSWVKEIENRISI